MTQEEIELLFKDLCGRLKYEPYINYNNKTYRLYICYLEDLFNKVKKHEFSRGYDIRNLIIKPYLRPMSSMTEEEKSTYLSYCECDDGDYTGEILYFNTIESFDYLNQIHVDYRNLISKGLAIKAPEGMYN